MKKHDLTAGFLMAMVCWSGFDAQAQTTYYWTGTDGGNWANDALWSTAKTPENNGVLAWGVDVPDSLTETIARFDRDTFAVDAIIMDLGATVNLYQLNNFAVFTTIENSGSGLIRVGAGGVVAAGSQDLVINTDVEFSASPVNAIAGDVIFNGAVRGGDDVSLTTGAGTYTQFAGDNTFSGTLITGGARLGLVQHALQYATLQHDAGVVNFLNSDSALGGLSGSVDIELARRNSAIDTNDRDGVTLTVGGNGRDTTFSGSLLNPSLNLGPRDAALVKEGAGTLTLSGNNTYIGATSVSAGGIIMDGVHAGAGAYTIARDAWLGGDGTIDGDVVFDAGAFLVFNPFNTLDVQGAVSMAASFGVASLVNADGSAVDWASVEDGVYVLLGSTSSDFSGISNYGEENAADVGGGRTAYFDTGSLTLYVVPEPGTLGLFAL
ncbi:MAG: autotransporter-associated beta strand repeat-containing protein, partial [Kiritimatiellia bacterium]